MTRPLTLLVLAPLLLLTTPAVARNTLSVPDAEELPAYLQCVPYARETSGVQIYGDAHTWWDQADGRFSRGNRPKKGAVMAFAASGAMRLGHVATVSRVIDKRTVLIDHANWSPINGRRGQIERDVKAIDVSPGNDWSEVRVWYAPIGDVGTTIWPVHGFIYGKGYAPRSTRTVRHIAQNTSTPARAVISPKFADAFAALPIAKKRPAHIVRNHSASNHSVPQQIPKRPSVTPVTRRTAGTDPLDAVVARYD